MINIRQRDGSPAARVTFSLDHPAYVSVVGDFNDWDPLRSPLIKRSNGLRSVAIEVPAGTELRFRYLDETGAFFNEPDADYTEPNGYGEMHSVVIARIPPPE